MCIMCVEIAKNRMKPFEARNALGEMLSMAKTEEERVHYLSLKNADDEALLEIAQKAAKAMES